jgi:hypothetical protein
MADIEYGQTPSAYTLKTGGGPAFSTPGYNTAGWNSFFDAMASQRAAREREERRRWDLEFGLKKRAMEPTPQERPAMVPQLTQQGYTGIGPGTDTMEVTSTGTLQPRTHFTGRGAIATASPLYFQTLGIDPEIMKAYASGQQPEVGSGRLPRKTNEPAPWSLG